MKRSHGVNRRRVQFAVSGLLIAIGAIALARGSASPTVSTTYPTDLCRSA